MQGGTLVLSCGVIEAGSGVAGELGSRMIGQFDFGAWAWQPQQFWNEAAAGLRPRRSRTTRSPHGGMRLNQRVGDWLSGWLGEGRFCGFGHGQVAFPTLVLQCKHLNSHGIGAGVEFGQGRKF